MDHKDSSIVFRIRKHKSPHVVKRSQEKENQVFHFHKESWMNFPWEHVFICKTQKCIGNHGDLRIHQSFRVEHSNGFYFSSIILGGVH